MITPDHIERLGIRLNYNLLLRAEGKLPSPILITEYGFCKNFTYLMCGECGKVISHWLFRCLECQRAASRIERDVILGRRDVLPIGYVKIAGITFKAGQSDYDARIASVLLGKIPFVSSKGIIWQFDRREYDAAAGLVYSCPLCGSTDKNSSGACFPCSRRKMARWKADNIDAIRYREADARRRKKRAKLQTVAHHEMLVTIGKLIEETKENRSAQG